VEEVNPAAVTPVVLVAEEDRLFRGALENLLQRRGYLTLPAGSAAEALRIADDYAPDLVILEWAMPGLSAPEELARLATGRTDGGPRLLILSRRRGEDDKVAALAACADDYVVKPCSPAELMARIHALMRRGADPHCGVLRAGPVELRLLSRRAFREDRPVALSASQFALLKHFVQHPGRMLSREHLRDALARPAIERRTIDVHVRRIRNALNRGGQPDLFRTVARGGYVFDPDQVRAGS